MNLRDAIHARRAVRAYDGRPVSEATLRDLLALATHAPSAMNRQPWLFALVQDRARLRRWSDRAKAMLLVDIANDPKSRHYEELLKSEAFDIFYDAGTLVVVGVAERGPYSDADCWLAAENFMLAACEAGLGTCPIGFAVPVLNEPDVKAELGLPAAGVAVAPLIVGYPSLVPPPVPRGEPRVVSFLR